MPLASSKRSKSDKDKAARVKEVVAHNMALAAKRCGELGWGPQRFLNSAEGSKFEGVRLTALKTFIKIGAPAGQKKALTDAEEARLAKYLTWRNSYNVPADRRDLEKDVICILEARRDIPPLHSLVSSPSAPLPRPSWTRTSPGRTGLSRSTAATATASPRTTPVGWRLLALSPAPRSTSMWRSASRDTASWTRLGPSSSPSWTG